MRGKWVPVPRKLAQMKPIAASPAGTTACSEHRDPIPHDFVAGDTHLGRFLQGRLGHSTSGAPQDDPVGLGPP